MASLMKVPLLILTGLSEPLFQRALPQRTTTRQLREPARLPFVQSLLLRKTGQPQPAARGYLIS